LTTAIDLLQRHFQTLVHDPEQWQTLIADDIVGAGVRACDRSSGAAVGSG